MTEPKATLPVTASQLEILAKELADWAERLKRVAEVARTQPEETLGIYNWRSVPKGMQLLSGFVNKAEESRSAVQLGRPLAIGQLKPRSTAKKPKVPPSMMAKAKDASEKAKADTKAQRAKKKAGE